jgi:hypothetical protein
MAAEMRMLLVTMLLCMLLCAADGANIGNRALNQRRGVPCQQLRGSHPGGATGVRRGNRCFVNSPASAARTFGRTISGVVRLAWPLTPNPNQRVCHHHPHALDELYGVLW